MIDLLLKEQMSPPHLYNLSFRQHALDVPLIDAIKKLKFNL